MKATVETAVEIERIIELHDNEKTILRFLICSMYYHGLICVKSDCKINHFLGIVNNILLSQLPPEEKIQDFQKYFRIYYVDFIKLHFYLKKLASLEKEKEENKKKEWSQLKE